MVQFRITIAVLLIILNLSTGIGYRLKTMVRLGAVYSSRGIALLCITVLSLDVQGAVYSSFMHHCAQSRCPRSSV